ncbi:MAG: GNAT family N-acetyltransferase [Paenibacillaceae bacterium]|nr:GNAT family N-acetyltransferase [Paenibacillaceae bacterium]
MDTIARAADGLRFIDHYRHHDAYRLSFNRLAHRVFGIDFERWYQGGYWGDSYRCHSIAADGDIVANVSVSRMLLSTPNGGTDVPALQIGTVMTHPDWRGRGLSGQLMERVLELYSPEGAAIFLFANERVLDFYPKYGFRRVAECRYACAAAAFGPRSPMEWRSLDMDIAADRELAYRLAQNRVPVSRSFAASGGAGLVMWYFLNVLSGGLLYAEEAETIVACELEGTELHVYDIVSAREDGWERVVAAVMPAAAERVVFHFTPDRLLDGPALANASAAAADSLLFVRGDWPLPDGAFQYPLTAQT